MDIEAIEVEGTEADISKVKAEPGKTMYVEQKWTNDPNDLMSSAKLGSCCSSIYLTDKGILNRSEWIDSLEGSELVA